MIIINLMGGLGNQMFQYATAKHLSIIHNTTLKIDTLNFRKLTSNKEHIFQLDRFKITAPYVNKREVKKYKTPRNILGAIIRFVMGIKTPDASHDEVSLLYVEPESSAFKRDVLSLGPDKYLIGYFNSFKYFDPIRKILIEEYTPREDIGEESKEIIKQIEDTESVSVHVRRGDYVTDPNVQKSVEGIITEKYYQNAINYIQSCVNRPHFYIFSNDMPWVIKNFKVPPPVTFVDINSPNRGVEDLWIMSKCKHNITAGGSSFSWWAAYLNQNQGKTVVRTKKISNDPRYNHPEDYFPGDWKAVES